MTLLAKIHAVRKLGLAVLKTGEITGKNNKIAYASYVDVRAALKAALDEQGLSTGFVDGEISPHGDGDRVSVTLVVSDGIEERATSFQILVPEKIVNQYGSSVINSGQRSAAAYSYARRNALICYFDVVTGDADAVERMNPEGGNSNIPGLIRINERTAWQDLTDGGWSNAESPLHDGTLAAYSGERAKMIALWTDYPNHAGIIAWAADWITANLQELGLSWADVMEEAPTLPSSIGACDGAAMRTAANATLLLRRRHKEGRAGQ